MPKLGGEGGETMADLTNDRLIVVTKVVEGWGER